MNLNLKYLYIVIFMALGSVAEASEPTPTQALAGVSGYGETGACIQDPGAQAGVYVYAGTDVPYEAPWQHIVLPDSLTPMHVVYVGRHGARFMTSRKTVSSLSAYLKENGPLTQVGKRVLALAAAVDSVTDGRWGALVPQEGRAELEGIGSRMSQTYAKLLKAGAKVKGEASYVPRCVQSMDMLTYGMVWECDSLQLDCASGTQFSPLLRPFDSNRQYLDFKDAGEWKRVLEEYADTVAPAATALRLTERGSRLIEMLCAEALARGTSNSGASLEVELDSMLSGPWRQQWVEIAGIDKHKAVSLAQDLYKLVSGCQAIGTGPGGLPWTVESDWRPYFTTMEYYKLWSIVNLRHYLTYSASGLSRAPALMAAPLLGQLADDLDSAARGEASCAANVYLGHAETLMPLMALMQLPRAYYLTSDWGSVALHWLDWNIVPMGSNLQFVLCRAADSGNLYLLTYLCEQPVGKPQPWQEVLTQWRERIAAR